METLKLSDSGNYFKGNCMLQPKCRQPYVHNDRKMKSEAINDKIIMPKLPPRPPLPETSQSSTTIDKDLAKQQQLSDWYYIKTGPKSPLPMPRTEKRNDIYGSTTTTSNRMTTNISNNNINNKSAEGIYGKTGNLSKETTRNNSNVYSENSNSRFGDDVQITKTNGNNNRDRMEDVYQAINFPSSGDSIQKMYTPPCHQYSGGEPLCKFNLGNNSEKVNGCSKWQQPQEIQHRLHMMAPSSPSVITKKLHQQQQQHPQPQSQQSHPFYYVEPSKRHLSSPQQDKHNKPNVEFQQKSFEPQCEQIQIVSKLQSHNERLNSTEMASTTLATMTSNSNSNLHKVSGLHSPYQQTHHCGNANSNSFEHRNVTSGFSSLSASSEMTIDDKCRFNNPNYADEQCISSSNNVVGESRQCLQQTSCPSPLQSATHPSKVSDEQTFCFILYFIVFFCVILKENKKFAIDCLG